MLIAICGSQGSGKSTLIKELQQTFPDINLIDRKTARSILDEWGTTLQEVYQCNRTMMAFQDEILERKIADEQIATISNDIWITERTYIDLLAFTVANLGRIDGCSEWLNAYASKCIDNQNNYDATFKLPAGKFEIEADGVRPTNPHYCNMIDTFMDKYLHTCDLYIHHVEHTNLQERTTECAAIITLIRG